MTRLEFDWSMNIGHLLTILGGMVALVAFIWNMRGALSKQSSTIAGHLHNIQMTVAANATKADLEARQNADRFAKIEAQMVEIAHATVTLARQDERMKAIEKRLEAIESNPHIDDKFKGLEKWVRSVEEDVRILQRPGG